MTPAEARRRRGDVVLVLLLVLGAMRAVVGESVRVEYEYRPAG